MKVGTVGLIVVLVLGILTAPLAADAQQAANRARIGFLGAASPSTARHLVEAFRQGLRERGWVEGQNLVIEYRWAEGKPERFPDLAAELVRLKVDLIYAGTNPAALAAQKATSTIPIVTAVISDPVQLGLVASLGRPGGNITGLTAVSDELSAKQLELLKETVPRVSRVAVLVNPAGAGYTLDLRSAQGAAQTLRVQLQIRETRGPDEFDTAFAAMSKERAGALLVLRDALFLVHRKRLVDLAAKHRLPTMFHRREFVEAGGLMAYSPSLVDLVRRAATYVDRILKGAKPADLPVEQASKFDLVINMKTAKAMGLTIPQSVLIRADEVIQ